MRGIAVWSLDNVLQLMEIILTRSGSRVAVKAVNDPFRIDPELRMLVVAIMANLVEDVD